MASGEADIAVEVVYALPERQWLVALTVRRGTTVREAVVLSGVPSTYPEMDAALGKGMIGIFGKHVLPDAALQQGDRVEIYRPMTADPKEARRRRAKNPK
jgi:uncharacterized protein